MIHRIKTVTWEVRSHGHCSALSDKGELMVCPALMVSSSGWSRPYIKKLVWHLQDVLKCMNRIEKEKQARKEKANENFPDEK